MACIIVSNAAENDYTFLGCLRLIHDAKKAATFVTALGIYLQNHILYQKHLHLNQLGQALDLLVTVSCTRYRASTSALSTLSSSRGLTAFAGISHLEGGFTLRCLQRLSRPDLATRPCPWQNNRYTRGQSIPVLSY